MIRNIFCPLAAAMLSLTPAAAAEKAMIVFDASGSMWGQIDGQNKIVIARDTLTRVLGTVPDDLQLGLIAYGHRKKGQCDDIERLVAPAGGQGGAIAAAVSAISPKGKTPLSDAVRMAAEELKYTEDKATVILITDGIETCNADPCALASELDKTGVDFTTHVIGFGLSAQDGKQVACIAENTGGQYLEAKNADSLADALTKTVVVQADEPPAEPEEPKPPKAALENNVSMTAYLDEEGTTYDSSDYFWNFVPVDGGDEQGFYGQNFERQLPAGRYRVTVTIGDVSKSFETALKEDELTRLEPVLDAGVLNVSVAADADAEADDQAKVEVRFSGKQRGGYGPTTFVVDAGEVELSGTLGKATVSKTLTIAAGQTVTEKLVAAAGVLNASAVYAEGGPAVEGTAVSLEVLEAKASTDGKRETIAGSYGSSQFKLPPGDYILQGRLGRATGEAPVTVKGGEAVDAVVNINGGVLAIIAPGAYSIEIFSAKKDLQGKRKSFGSKYGEEFQQTLPPGDYVVDAVMGESGGTIQQATVSVKAAERSEIEVK